MKRSARRQRLRIAVVGGGINGVAVAWRAAERGHEVSLYERGEFMGETSAASTKLLHGGLRYLEQGRLRLVREALTERRWWLDHAPQFTRPVDIAVPVYRGMRRGRWRLKAGLWLYDRLAGRQGLGGHRWLGPAQVLERVPGLRAEGLEGAYLFRDGQMDDRCLGLWAVEQARAAGARLVCGCAVTAVDAGGRVWFGDSRSESFDRVVNAAGPWAGALLAASGIAAHQRLRLVRGSHLLLAPAPPLGLLLEHPQDGRAFFVLPYGEQALVGTTEVPQTLEEPVICSPEETTYLLAGRNAYLGPAQGAAEVLSSFAGLRPLVRSGAAPTATSRESKLERNGRLLTVWGGKWTTARALAGRAIDTLEGPMEAIRPSAGRAATGPANGKEADAVH